ncbi:hypothetical protein PAMC26577_04585 [Caballeronia sordidicola]|uniref:Uncharacterized protein n=1 Tax=Caballeronia sordidicola TaxID=196367 RepID=A0A242N4C7_CABSO|nr:hypothetical protein PAMC26577_04585 [Caballeronia sordidicola]
MLVHQPQYAGPGDADVAHDAQPRPDLAVPLAMKGEAARSSRMACSRSAAGIFGFGPRLRGSIGVTLALARARTA